MSHVSAVSHARPLASAIGKVRWLGEVHIVPVAPIGNQVVSTPKGITSHLIAKTKLSTTSITVQKIGPPQTLHISNLDYSWDHHIESPVTPLENTSRTDLDNRHILTNTMAIEDIEYSMIETRSHQSNKYHDQISFC